jgi:Na+/H+ antiporter NhaC
MGKWLFGLSCIVMANDRDTPDDVDSPGDTAFPDEPDVEGMSEAEEEEPDIDFYGGKWLSALPIGLFIVWAIVQTALFRISDTTGLVIGMLISLMISLFFVKGDWKHYANTIFEGMTQRVAATAIVAWLWAGMFAATLQVGGFVDGLIWLANTLGIGPALFPALTFVLAAVFATAVGTGYGTTVAFVVLFFPAGVLLGANPVLLFASILSGAAFGDNIAPVSDTTIVSAVTQDSDIGGVVASRFKYAIMPAILAFVLYIVAGNVLGGGLAIGRNAENFIANNSNPLGLVHLVSMAVVIWAAVRGRHIVEAITWGIVVAIVFNLVFGLAPVSEMLVFKMPSNAPVGDVAAALPFVTISESPGVAGSLYSGASGFFALSILTLLIVAAAQIMIRGGAFEALQNWLLESVATDVRRAELSMVGGTAFVNTIITINTAAEIAIAPYISTLGEKFNINGYRRANILDANTTAMGYVFPWSGAVLVGLAAMQTQVAPQYEWFTQAMVVNPAAAVPFVFHCWLLLATFVISAWTGFGREYTIDRDSEEVSRV